MSKLASDNYNNIEVKAEVHPYTSKSNLLRYFIFISNSYEVEDCPALKHHVENILMMTLLLALQFSKIKFYKTVDKLTDKSSNH